METYEEKGKVSSVLAEQPEIPSRDAWLWNAFWDLSSTRQDIFPISYSNILAYCLLQGKREGEDIQLLLAAIRRLDPLWLEWANKKGSENG